MIIDVIYDQHHVVGWPLSHNSFQQGRERPSRLCGCVYPDDFAGHVVQITDNRPPLVMTRGGIDHVVRLSLPDHCLLGIGVEVISMRGQIHASLLHATSINNRYNLCRST